MGTRSLFGGLPQPAARAPQSSSSDDEQAEELADLPDDVEEEQAMEESHQELRRRPRHRAEEEEEEDGEVEAQQVEEPQLKRRRRDEDEGATTDHAEPAAQPDQPAPAPGPSTQPDQVAAALQRLTSHISNPTKFAKASPLLRQLISTGSPTSALGRQHRALAFSAISAAFSLQPGRHKHLVDPLNRREVLKLVAAIQSLAEDYFKPAERAQINGVYAMLGGLCNEMNTDDSFVFSKVIAKLRTQVDDLPECDGDTADEAAAFRHVTSDLPGLRPGAAPEPAPHQPPPEAAGAQPGTSASAVARQGSSAPQPQADPPAAPSTAPRVPDPDDPFGLDTLMQAAPPEDDPFGLGALMPEPRVPKPAPKPKAPKPPEPASTAWGPVELLAAKRAACLLCLQHARTFHKHAWAQGSIELLVEHCWQNRGRFSSLQQAELDELWAWVRKARAARKTGPTAKEINRDSTSFERARADWGKVNLSSRGKVGSNGDAKASSWLG